METKTVITYNVELETNDAPIIPFLEQVQEIFNFVSKLVFDNKPSLSLKLVHDLCYYKTKNKFPDVPTQLIIKCQQDVMSAYKSIKSNKHKLKEPIKKDKLNLRLDKNLCSKFTQTSIKINIGTGARRPTFNFKLYPKIEELLKNHTTCDPILFSRKGKTYLSIPFEVPSIQPKDDSILGVDLGMRRLFVTSDGDCLKSTEYLKQKRKIRYLKRILQAKGTKSAKRHRSKLKKKEQNFSKNYCHHMANQILKTDKSIIVMEDLSKIKTKKSKYQNLNAKSQIPFYTLLSILTYKAPRVAKQVVTVNPSFTSQDDCRRLERGERKGCRYYAVDGVIFDADYNASMNIANKYSEHPISFKLPLDGSLNLLGRLLSTNQS